MNRRTKLLLTAQCVIITVSLGQAQEIHDDHSDHTLEVSRALPAFMIEGPHYRIVDPVVNEFALDQFTIESDFGTFHAYGQLMLRIILREIQAIAALRQASNTAIAKGAVTRDLKKTVSAVGQVGRHPIKSTKGIAKGLTSRFKKWTRDVVEDVQIARSKEISTAEKKAIISKRWLGVEESRRRIAGELLIDPYTENPILQEELELVARADATANLTTKLLMPKIPGTDLMRDVHKIVTTYDYRELLAYNQERLIGLGASTDDIDYFLSLEYYNPTGASLLISLILELDGVQNQIALFDQALGTESAVDALFFIDCVAMTVWYHKNRQPLRSMYLTTGLPAGTARNGDLIVFAATDFPHWTDLQSSIVAQLDFAYKPLSSSPTLMLAGNASKTFKREVAVLDWKLEINIRNEYLPALPWAMTDAELQAGN